MGSGYGVPLDVAAVCGHVVTAGSEYIIAYSNVETRSPAATFEEQLQNTPTLAMQVSGMDERSTD